MLPMIGLVGIVGEAMSEDFWGALERVAAIGYEGIEAGEGILAKSGATAAEYRDRMAGLGLATVTCHTTKYGFADKGDAIVAEAKAIGCGMITMAWGPVESVGQLLEDAALYNKIGQRCKDAGLRLAYHNHDHEFQAFDGATAFDILMANTDPALLLAHIDAAWATFGGVDPAALIRQYAGRCPAVHAKDLASLAGAGDARAGDREKAEFIEVGAGIVDMPGVAAAAKECGVAWLTVEQDRPSDLAPFESIQVSFDNLNRMVMAEENE